MPETPTVTELSSRTAGLILAGGSARRLGGVDKASLRVGGLTLLRRAMVSLRGQCSTLAVASRAGTRPISEPGTGVLNIHDDGTGPASAVLLAARQLLTGSPRLQWLLIVAVDAPFAPSDFLERAGAILQPPLSAVVGMHDNRPYPTHALWRLKALVELAGRTKDTANLSLFSLLDQIEWRSLEFASPTAENPFANINTSADLVACNRRAMGGKTGSTC